MKKLLALVLALAMLLCFAGCDKTEKTEEKKATEKIKASMETSILPIDTSEAEAPFSFFADHYAPIVSRQSRDVTIDGSWINHHFS